MTSLTLLVRIVASLMIGLLGSVVWMAASRRRRAWSALIVALLMSIASFGGTLGLRTIPPQPVVVTIDSPRSETTVDGITTVITGTISLAEARVTVLVHPRDSNRWWVQERPVVTITGSAENRIATWRTTIYLGTETRGKGEAFEVVAIGSQDSILFDILTERYVPVGAEITSLPELSQSNPVILYRSNR